MCRRTKFGSPDKVMFSAWLKAQFASISVFSLAQSATQSEQPCKPVMENEGVNWKQLALKSKSLMAGQSTGVATA